MTHAPESKRLYQVWKGNNRFFCGGRCVFGPDMGSLLLSVLLIVGPLIAFCYQISAKIQNREKQHEKNVFHDQHHALDFPVLVLTTIIMIADLIFLLLTASRDPGIVPRNNSMESSDTSFNTPSMEWINGRALHMKYPRTKDIIINGFAMKIKYCDTCLLYRPPRTSHCSVCNNCVQKFDHHCPWVGQCIGLRNYRYFFLFISTSTFLCIFVFTLSLMNILQERKMYHSFLKLMVGEVISVILILYTFMSIWFVGGLTIFHLYLICTNQTTYENFRYHYDKKDNPYNIGILKNLKEVFFSGIEPSMINFRSRMLDGVMENGHYDSHMGVDIVSSIEKFDIEIGSMLEGSDDMSIPSILQNFDYRSVNENHGAVNDHKDESFDQSALVNVQENGHLGSREYEQIGAVDGGKITVHHKEHMTEEETVIDSALDEAVHQQPT